MTNSWISGFSVLSLAASEAGAFFLADSWLWTFLFCAASFCESVFLVALLPGLSCAVITCEKPAISTSNATRIFIIMIFSRAAAYAITLALRLDDPPKDKSCEPTFGDFGN